MKRVSPTDSGGIAEDAREPREETRKDKVIFRLSHWIGCSLILDLQLTPDRHYNGDDKPKKQKIQAR